MDQKLISTRSVAALLNVAETTVKRWADDNTLPCVKSPGGHRKFLVQQVIEFAEKHKYPLTGLLPPPLTQQQRDQLQLGVYTRNFSLLSKIFLEEAFQADRYGLRDLMSYIYKHHISYGDLVDHIIRPVMEQVGILWEQKKLEVNQEHKISQTVTEALHWFSTELYKKPKNGQIVVLSCGEQEFHCLGLQAIAYGLECEGWTVQFLGANMPYDSLHSYIKSVKPAVVCLSLTVEKNMKNKKTELRHIAHATHSSGGILILGGAAVQNASTNDFGCDYIANSLHETIVFADKHLKKKTRYNTKTKKI